MSSKTEKPTLQGQRIKTRKRDEKEKYDPNGFREIVLYCLNYIISPQSETIAKNLPTENESNLNSTEENSLQDQISDGQSSSDDENAQSEEECIDLSANGGDKSPQKTVKLTTKEIVIEQAHFEALSKFLDISGSKLNYRRYGDVLLDILIAGGSLAPGGSILINPDPSKPSKTDLCLFSISENNLADIKNFGQVIHKLIRRYLYLEKILDEEIKKFLLFLKGFSPEIRVRLAKFVAILISIGQISSTVLISAIQESSVKDGIAMEFLVNVLQVWLAEKDANSVWSALKKSGIDSKILNFLPVNKQSFEQLESIFLANNLGPILELQKASMNSNIKKKLQNEIHNLIVEKAPMKEIVLLIKESMAKNKLVEHEVIIIVWNTVMSANEWSKKEDLIADQAIRFLKGYVNLFICFTTKLKSSLALMNRIQEYCYENMNFLKVFSKIILLFYKAEVLDEDTIFRWYREAHSSKGKSVFLDQMKKFIEWLENAEEESEDE